MAVFKEFRKIRGTEPFGSFPWTEVQINRRLQDEDPAIVEIVEAHEKEHERDYGVSGVNAKDDPHFEPRAHLAALRKATSNGRRLTDLQARTEMGADVLKDLLGIDAAFQQRCQRHDIAVTYEENENTKFAMSTVLWKFKEHSEKERIRKIRSRLVKAFAGTILLTVAGFYLSLGAIYAPVNQNPTSSSTSTLESTLIRSANTPLATRQFTQTPTIIFQNSRCMPVTGNFDQSVSAWKTRNPGIEPYYYGEVNKIGEKSTPCR